MTEGWNISFEATHDRHEVRRWMVLFPCALVVLGIFQSASLVSLAYDLPPFWADLGLVGLAEIWHEGMQFVGAASVTEWVQTSVQGLHDDWSVFD